MLDSESVATIAADLRAVASREINQGKDFRDGGAEQQWGDFQQRGGQSRGDLFTTEMGGVNQRVWMLGNKGEGFRQILRQETVLKRARAVLGESILLSSHTANITRAGGLEMPLHTDQFWMPQPVLPGGPEIVVGDIRRDRVPVAPPTSPQTIAPAGCINMIWMLVDFTEANGATRVVLGSHLRGSYPSEGTLEGDRVIQATAPAGTALMIDGRIWHGTAANTGGGERLAVLTTFCGPQFRPQENYVVGTDGEVLGGLDNDMRELLGFRIWNGYGRTGDPTEEWALPR